MARNDTHSHRTCRDPDCLRLPCQAYREGYDDGYTDATAAAAEAASEGSR